MSSSEFLGLGLSWPYFSLNFYFICIHITLQLTTRHDKTSIHTNGIQKKVV